jgi:hypothetical protein
MFKASWTLHLLRKTLGVGFILSAIDFIVSLKVFL